VFAPFRRSKNVIRPSVTTDRGPMAAVVIGAIDEGPANASGAHLAKADLPSGEDHAPLKRRDREATNLAVRPRHGPALGALGADEAGAVPGPQTSALDGVAR
jgi:hypothetical protein